jgi:HK97 family phage portal protein
MLKFNLFSNTTTPKIKESIVTEPISYTSPIPQEDTPNKEKKNTTPNAQLYNKIKFFTHAAKNANALSMDTMMGFYRKNAVLQSVIGKMGRLIASIQLSCLHKKTQQCIDHPILDLLAKPNAYQDGYHLRENLMGHLLLYGNAYLELEICAHNTLHESNDQAQYQSAKKEFNLFVLDPRDITIQWHEKTCEPQFYKINNGDGKFRIINAVSKRNAKSAILHLRLFNPANIWFGLSPIEALYPALQIYDLIAEQNISSIRNLTNPSGILNIKDNLDAEEFNEVHAKFAQFMGPHNTGNTIMTCQGNIEWHPLKKESDFDFTKGRQIITEEIAAVYGMPDILIHARSAGSDNYKQARLHWIEEIISPMSIRFVEAMQNWLLPYFTDSEEVQLSCKHQGEKNDSAQDHA